MVVRKSSIHLLILLAHHIDRIERDTVIYILNSTVTSNVSEKF